VLKDLVKLALVTQPNVPVVLAAHHGMVYWCHKTSNQWGNQTDMLQFSLNLL
jgi:hypothetical protein